MGSRTAPSWFGFLSLLAAGTGDATQDEPPKPPEQLIATSSQLVSVTAGAETSRAAIAPRPLATLSLDRPVTFLPMGHSLILTAARGSFGNPLSAVPGPRWTSDNAAVAAVNPEGLVSGRAVGSAKITVSAGGRSAMATDQVVAPGSLPLEIQSCEANTATACGT